MSYSCNSFLFTRFESLDGLVAESFAELVVESLMVTDTLYDARNRLRVRREAVLKCRADQGSNTAQIDVNSPVSS